MNSIFIKEEFQAILNLFILSIWLYLLMVYQPYSKTEINIAEFLSIASIYLVAFCGFCFYTSLMQDSVTSFLNAATIIILIYFLLRYIVTGLWIWYQLNHETSFGKKMGSFVQNVSFIAKTLGLHALDKSNIFVSPTRIVNSVYQMKKLDKNDEEFKEIPKLDIINESN